MELAERWPLTEAGEVRDALIRAYGDTPRGYHDLRHLTEVLDRLEELSTHGERFSRQPVQLAAWFHDGVYDGRPGAEQRSADWARTALTGVVEPQVVDEVERLVLLTADHAVGVGDRNGAALCDADLAILAAPLDRYAAYASDVRREYVHLSDREFAEGRAAILRRLLGRGPLFASAYGRDQWERAARANIDRELARLPDVG